jgi:hypothetical protein
VYGLPVQPRGAHVIGTPEGLEPVAPVGEQKAPETTKAVVEAGAFGATVASVVEAFVPATVPVVGLLVSFEPPEQLLPAKTKTNAVASSALEMDDLISHADFLRTKTLGRPFV